MINKKIFITGCGLKNAGVYIAVSKEAEIFDSGKLERWIEIHWWGVDDHKFGDWVGLWDRNPLKINKTHSTQKIEDVNSLYSKLTTNTGGGFKTDVLWDDDLIPNTLDSVQECLPYWAAYVRNSTVLYSSCLRIRPNWMEKMKNTLKSFTFAEVTWPGIHENGYAGNLAHSAQYTLTKNWDIFPGMSLWKQLVLGIRYIDLRLSFDASSNKLVVLHGNIPVIDLVTVLKDLTKFIEQTSEIVILNISYIDSSTSVSDDFNKYLISILKYYLEKWSIPRSLAPNPKLEEIWDLNSRILVIYPEPTNAEFLWESKFGELFNAPRLEDYLMILAQPILEETGTDLKLEKTVGVIDQKLTSDSYVSKQTELNTNIHPLTLRIQRNWCSLFNILSADFFLSTDIVSISIEVNNRFNDKKHKIDDINIEKSGNESKLHHIIY